MPRICAVVGCDTNRRFYELGLRFYAFPTQDLAARERWRELCGRDASWPIPKLRSVCQKHFPVSEVEGASKLAETVMPTLNLPGAVKVESASCDEEPPEETTEQDKGEPQPARRRNPPRRRRKPRKIMSDQEEEEKPERSTRCRLCALEISPEEGQSMEDLRSQERVGDSIWDICLVDFESTDFEKLYSRICGNCWRRLVAFDDFAALCSSKQSKLFKAFKDQGSSKNDDYEEPHIEEPVENTAELQEEVLEETQIKDEDLDQDNSMEDCNELSVEAMESTEDRNHRPTAGDDNDFELPSLEGLSIEEMIEALERVSPNKQIREDYAIDQECWDCGQVFPRLWLKKKHRKTCALIGKPESLRNKTYVCEICQKNIRTRAGYRLHLVMMHHEQISSGKLDCPDELRKVQSRKRYACPVCSKKFQQLNRLKYHLRTHLNRQQAGLSDSRKAHGSSVCQVCGKVFGNTTLLKTHLMFHMKQKDFGCDQCEKRFYTKVDLNDHVDSIHRLRKFPCAECGKTYTVRRSLFRHNLVVHRGAKARHECAYCGKAFMSPMERRYHEMVHTGEKNFRCEQCGHAFRQRFELTQHRIRVHGEQVAGVKLYRKYQRKKPRDSAAAAEEQSQDTEEQYDEVEYLMNE